MTAPTVVTLTLDNEDAATAVGGSGTIQIQLLEPISGQDGKIYTMAAPETFLVAAGEFSEAPSLRSTDGTNSLYRFIVNLDDWTESFNAPLPAGVTTMSAIRALATTAGASPSGGPFVPLAMLGAPNGAARLGADGLLVLDERPAGTAGTYAAHAGLRDATVLVDSGMTGAVLLEADTTYQNLIFNVDSIKLPSGAKLENCHVIGNAVNAVLVDADTGLETGRRIKNCLIENPAGRAIAGAGFTAENVLATGLGDDFFELGRAHGEPTVLRGCKGINYRPLAGAHFDGVQVVTTPAAPIIIEDCDLTMTADPDYVVPDTAGSTGSIFFAPDVAIGAADPDPTRIGRIYVVNSLLNVGASGDYSMSIAMEGIVTVAHCAVGTGVTGTENISVNRVFGWGNTDLSGNPLRTAIGGSDLGDYLLAGDPRAGGGGTLDSLTDVDVAGAVDGQVLGRVGGVWKGVAQAAGGGAAGTPPTFYSTGMFAGVFGPAGSGVAPDFTPDTQPGAGFLIKIPGTDVQVGNLIHWEFRFISTGADAQLDVASIVGGQPVNYYSDDFGPSQNPVGAGDLYQSGNFGFAQPIEVYWIVQATDLDPADGDSLTLSLLYAPGGSRMFGLADQVGKVTAINYH